jgi:uncharacterized delta-60 repeat protein
VISLQLKDKEKSMQQWRYFVGTFSFALALAPAMLLASGELDLDFGKNGKIITDLYSTTDVASNLLISEEGKITLLGGSTARRVTDQFALVQYNVDGSLDFSFGKMGVVTTDKLADNLYVSEEITGAAVQSNGKMVVCGRGVSAGEVGFIVLRYNLDGSIDDTFGQNGSAFVADSLQMIHPLALSVDTSDRIIVAASSFDSDDRSAFVLHRFDKEGALDQTFGDKGCSRTKITEGADVPRAVKVDKKGNIVVAGFNGDSKFVVARYDNQGILDASFGNKGIATIEFNEGGVDTCNALAIQDDGKIVVGGDVQVGSFAGFRMIDFGLARLNSDGTLDLSFNNSGKKIIDFVQPAASSLWALALQKDGKILAAGDASIIPGLGVARINVDGSLDESFADLGKQTVPFGRTCHFESVAIQKDGKIVVGGYVWNGKHYDLAAVRLNP